MIIGTVAVIAGRPTDGSMVIFSSLAMIEQVSQGKGSAPGGVCGLSDDVPIGGIVVVVVVVVFGFDRHG